MEIMTNNYEFGTSGRMASLLDDRDIFMIRSTSRTFYFSRSLRYLHQNLAQLALIKARAEKYEAERSTARASTDSAFMTWTTETFISKPTSAIEAVSFFYPFSSASCHLLQVPQQISMAIKYSPIIYKMLFLVPVIKYSTQFNVLFNL